MRNPKLLRAAILCFVIAAVSLSFMGCGGLKGKAAYLDARIIFNDTVEELTKHRATLPTEEQAEMTDRVGPYLEAAETGLDAWGLAIASDDVEDEEARWHAILTALIDVAREFLPLIGDE